MEGSDSTQPKEGVDSTDAWLETVAAACFEGDIFAALRSSPFAIRSFEFSGCDGAIDCSDSYPLDMDYAARHWNIVQDSEFNRHDILLFDVKSKVTRKTEDQNYNTTGVQRQKVAFYIGIRAVDSGFIELIPNFQQYQPSCDQSLPASGNDEPQDLRESAVIHTRSSLLQQQCYHLPLSVSPYRMPIGFLPEALNRVRQCARGEIQEYVNPWTSVHFAGWRPSFAQELDALFPTESSEHYSSYLNLVEIQRVLDNTVASRVWLDFVGTAPRLADFVLKIRDTSKVGGVRQIFVQHKDDVRYRAKNNPLMNVAIGRKEGDHTRSFFSVFDSFDFIFYQFSNISNRPQTARSIVTVFFIPECRIPEDFYTTSEVEASFDRADFQEFRITVDAKGNWVQMVLGIIDKFPSPRRRFKGRFREQIIRIDRSSSILGHERKLRNTELTVQHGRHRFTEITQFCHRQIWWGIMRDCALRRSGMLIQCSADCPAADFLYVRYRWTSSEQRRFLHSGTPPKTLSDLRGETAAVPLYFLTQTHTARFAGPAVSASQFRRLDSCRNKRLILWNLVGELAKEDSFHESVALIPSEDFNLTEQQSEIFLTAQQKQTDGPSKNNRQEELPTLGECLSTGMHPSEYVIGRRGPLLFDAVSVWNELRDILETLACPGPDVTIPRHPLGRLRLREAHRTTVGATLQRLADEHRHQTVDADQRTFTRAGPAARRGATLSGRGKRSKSIVESKD